MHEIISILGSTGAVGQKALEVAKYLGVRVASLACKSNIDLLEKQAREFDVRLLAVFDQEAALALQKRMPHATVLSGRAGLIAAANAGKKLFLSMSGIEALECALQFQGRILLANKELLVVAGDLLKHKEIIPVDSELSTVFQCAKGEKIKRIILTASGGAFLRGEGELMHPHFTMGKKGMLDSATMLNKAREMIAAKNLFGAEVDVVIHPEQKVQSMVEFEDGAMMAVIAAPDMWLWIQYALTYPERMKSQAKPVTWETLHFEKPNLERFRCLALGFEAMKQGGSVPVALNAAGEVLSERCLAGEFSWKEVGGKLEKIITSHERSNVLSLGQILEVDTLTREKARVV